MTYNPDGRVVSRSFAAPEDATGAARSNVERALTQMTDVPVVFPEEDLGTGARWTVSGQVEDPMLGVSMRQGVTFTLLSREGSRIELGVEVERTPSVQKMAGSDLNVVDSSSDSDGNVTVDLRRPVPVSGMIDTTTSVTYGQAESPVTVVQTSRTRSAFESTSSHGLPGNCLFSSSRMASWSAVLVPQLPVGSTTKSTDVGRCSRDASVSISIAFLSSVARRRTPGVSVTWYRDPLESK